MVCEWRVGHYGLPEIVLSSIVEKPTSRSPIYIANELYDYLTVKTQGRFDPSDLRETVSTLA